MFSKSEKNVLLVNPWIIDFKAYDLWMKPLGLLYISAILRKNGYKVSFTDCMDRNHPSIIGKKKLKADNTGKFVCKIIEKPGIYASVPRKYKIYGIPVGVFHDEMDRIPKPDLVMVTSMMTYWYPGVHHAISILKERFPGVPVILGGIYASLCQDFAREHSGADFVFAGNDALKLMELVGNLTGSKPAFIPGNFLYYPQPDYSGYSLLDYCAIITSVGCPFNCSYCASKKLYPAFLKRNPGDVVNEIMDLHKKYGVIHFAFYDDALLVDRDNHVMPTLEKLIKEKGEKQFYFHTPNGLHARFVNKDLAVLMKEAGFETIRLGLETMNDPDYEMKSDNKVNLSEIENAVESLMSAGFAGKQIGIYLMMGLPGQSPENVDKALDFVCNLGVQNRLSFYSPVPGTPDFDKIKSGFPGEMEDPLYHNNTYHMYYGDRTDPETIKNLKDKAFRLNASIL